MQPFEYHQSSSSRGAIDFHQPKITEYLAGGTTLIDLMKLHVMTPTHLVDLTPIPLKEVRDLGDAIEIDAMVSNNEMAYHPLVKANFPFVSEALLSGASVQLRNLATTAGNILQKTRCPYYRDTTARCNKRSPGSGCDALEGFNRMHAILGTSEHCIAANPSDLNIALMAAETKIKTESVSGPREIPFEKFFTLPGTTPHIENVLQEGELITSIRIPKKPCLKNSTYVKIRDRSSYAFALTSAAVALEMEGDRVREARIAVGGVGTVPWRACESEKVLKGKPLMPETLHQAAKRATDHAVTRMHNDFKVPLLEQTILRAFQELRVKS